MFNNIPIFGVIHDTYLKDVDMILEEYDVQLGQYQDTVHEIVFWYQILCDIAVVICYITTGVNTVQYSGTCLKRSPQGPHFFG